MNSLVATEDVDTQVWSFKDDKEKYGFAGTSSADNVNFDCYGEECFIKSNLGSTIETFISCDFNDRFVTDFSLEKRSCVKCPIATPFSLGFAN